MEEAHANKCVRFSLPGSSIPSLDHDATREPHHLLASACSSEPTPTATPPEEQTNQTANSEVSENATTVNNTSPDTTTPTDNSSANNQTSPENQSNQTTDNALANNDGRLIEFSIEGDEARRYRHTVSAQAFVEQEIATITRFASRYEAREG